MSQYYDLTAEISEDIVVFPGDPTYKSDDICTLTNNSNYHLCYLHLGNHTGTHIDFPAHVIKKGKTSNDFLISDLIGSGLIIEVPNTEKSITSSFVEAQSILPNDIVFFKTSNSQLSKHQDFTSQYVFIESDGAKALLRKKVKIVGIDYISVDCYEAENLPVHQTLLTNDILIVEGLELSQIPTGRYNFYIMPLRIANMDGLPVRVLATL